MDQLVKKLDSIYYELLNVIKTNVDNIDDLSVKDCSDVALTSISDLIDAVNIYFIKGRD